MNESDQVISEKNYLIKNVSIVAICRIAGVATGIVADAMILNKFGVGKETDALFAAIAVPLVFTRILEIQAPNVLVPVFSSDAARYDREKFSYYTGNFIVITALILFIFSLAGIAASGFLMSIQVPGFQDSARYLAIGLSKILFWLIFIQGLDTIIKCLLLSQHHFVIASSSKILVNLALVASIIILQSQFSIYAVAIGYIVGSIVSLCMVSSAVFIAGIRIKLVCKINDKQFHHTMKLFALPLSGHVFGESKDLFENYIVSFLDSGSLSILRYATRIITAITGVLLGGVVTTTLPLISQSAAHNDYVKMKESFVRALKVIALIAMPVCMWLIFTSKSLLVLLFVRGEFTLNDATLASIIIALMTPYVLFSRLISVSQTPFFATMDMKIPLYSMLVSFTTYIAIALLLIKFTGIMSFPIAHSISTFCTSTFILSILIKRFGPFMSKDLYTFSFRLFIVTICTGIVFYCGTLPFNNFINTDMISRLISFCIPSALGFSAFIVASIFFKLGDWNFFTKLFKIHKVTPSSIGKNSPLVTTKDLHDDIF
jgi:putative peptidoglycan lipid II flippase